MENKLSQFEQMMQELKSLSGNNPRETALDDQGLNFIGRPLDQLEGNQLPEREIASEPSDVLESIPQQQIEIPQVEPLQNIEPSPLPEMESAPVSLSENLPSEDIDMSQPEFSSVQEPDKRELLLQEFRKAQEDAINNINTAAEQDRSSQKMQRVLGGLGKALTYSSSAGGKFMSSPIPLEFKPMDFGYLDQAMKANKIKLEGLKDEFSFMREQAKKGYTTKILDMGDSQKLISYDDEGNIVKEKDLGQKGLSLKDKIYAGVMQEQLELGKERLEGTKERFDKNLGFKKGQLEFQKEKQQYKVGEEQELSDKQLDSIASFDKVLDISNQIEDQYKNVTKKLGPYASKSENLKDYVPFAEKDPEFVKMQSLVVNQLSQYIKAMSGLTVSDKERAQLERVAPKMEDKPQEFMTKLKQFKNMTNSMKNQELKAMKNYQGKNVQGYSPEKKGPSISQPSNIITRMTKDGRKAMFDADTKKFIKYEE